MSIILDSNDIKTIDTLTCLVGVAVSKAIDSKVGCDTLIKWVNDIYSNNRKLSGILGMTPSEFIKERRLITAAQMLSQGKVIVGEVCYRVGFSSKSYFSRCFKERFGKTPSEYSNTILY